MKTSKTVFKAVLLGTLVALPMQLLAKSRGQGQVTAAQAQESASMTQAVDRIVQHEQHLMQEIRKYSPRAETYLQQFKIDPELGPVVSGDQYYLGRLKFGKNLQEATLHPEQGRISHIFADMHNQVLPLYGARLNLSTPGILIDERFDRAHYDFVFLQQQFLGEVRCLVFNVTPKRHAGSGLFKGRIWVEDKDYNIVRFNGTHVSGTSSFRKTTFEAHEDSWRQNLQPGLWLPVYVYSEESSLKIGRRVLRLKAATWLWGYKLSSPDKQEELTKVLVDAPVPVRDTDASHDLSPLDSQRRWEKEAEDNILERLERAGLIAPSGPVDNVLATVANNLVVSNNLNNFPDLRCRVMLTAPLESVTVGHTIVLSRGLVDVLPDETSLAMVMAHEIGHILTGGPASTKYAFDDVLSISDEDVLNALALRSDGKGEEAADRKGVELLKNSPYKDKLGNAGLFLKALSAEAQDAPNLLGAQLGNKLVQGKHLMRMAELMSTAPELKPKEVGQIAALPLGSRIKMDAWSGQVELVKSKPVALFAAKEKMPFQVTHFFPYLTRSEAAAQKSFDTQNISAQQKTE
jgi:hypothetical protein